MSGATTKTTGGVGFFGLLFITFLVLKLTHVIDWSWWLITMPLWCPALIELGVILGLGYLVARFKG